MDINNIIDSEINLLLNKNLNIKNDNPNKILNLVISGGSIKGFAILGSLHYLTKNKLLNHLKNISATSVGSMIAFLYIINYSAHDIYKLLKNIKTTKLTKPNFSSILTNFGLDNGERMILVLKRLMKNKNIHEDITFKQLFNISNKTLIITGSCLNDKKCYYFSKNTYPDMKILDAIRISISVPLFFTPVKFENKLFVDGGCIDNYPIKIFDDELNNTIGLYIHSNKKNKKKISNIESYFTQTLACIMEGNNKLYTYQYQKQSIIIKCKDIGINPQKSLQEKDIIDMFDTGYISTKKFFEN
jgi:NTE family protein